MEVSNEPRVKRTRPPVSDLTDYEVTKLMRKNGIDRNNHANINKAVDDDAKIFVSGIVDDCLRFFKAKTITPATAVHIYSMRLGKPVVTTNKSKRRFKKKAASKTAE